ncbi:peptidase M50 [Iodidimonas muriae]|uniref:Zinc metalloprotease n=1 Tax=Iodidimonas muriae TaxID=261467 RepID=A0ABQ2LEU1_9PROT|nr:site-2 protease family protein [Iodidimonas muriae]GER07615.1 peptidase M50 [Kordiimonadales bacterium JCM 17843]GGO13730.1 peptidase M50 [Iodidimonas muriae]
MTDHNLTLFTLFGFRVRANPSWLLLAALITWSLAEGLFPQEFPDLPASLHWSLGIVGMIGLFFSLLFHEFSHSLVARRRGMKIGGITLFLFGGVAELTDEPPTPRIEFEVAAAGPIASVFLALIFGLLSLMAAGLGAPDYWAGLLGYLGTINMVLAVFNLVPGYPLDGGRLLRAWLWHRRGDQLSATRTASRFGKGFGLFLIILGIWSFLSVGALGGMWWILIGFFIMSAAKASYDQLLARSLFHHVPLEGFVVKAPVCVEADMSIDHFVKDYAYHHHFSLYPVMKNRKLVGCVRTRDVQTIHRDEWATSPLSDIMLPLTEKNSTPLESDAEQVLQAMQRHNSGQMIVLDGDRLAGIITLRDLLGALELRRQIEGQG